MRFVKMLIVSGAFLGMPLASTASDCPHSEPRDATLDAAGATTLRVEAEAGILMIRGTSGLTEVRVQGKACAPDKDVLDEIEHVGGPVSIEDGSGEITVRDTEAGVEIVEDGSGSIELDHIGGDVVVQEDGSGSIRAEHVAGDFIVERDGSGGVTFNHIEGDIKVP